ncbi:MAG: O-antigen ligase family protein [Acidobacteria bacterium]|nr:O-antigen ligase family protein [Acidobacteriota bacterium]
MPSNSHVTDYEPLHPRRRGGGLDEPDALRPRAVVVDDGGLFGEGDSFASSRARRADGRTFDQGDQVSDQQDGADAKDREDAPARAALKHGHALAYAGLFLFTFVVYFRPYELVPALAFLASSVAFSLAILTLLIYFPTQLGLEGNLTAPLREVKLAAALCVLALASVPLAINRGEAWDTWVDYLKVVLMFVVMVNVMRTEKRLRWLVLLLLAASVFLSLGAISDYRAGRFNTGGDRIAGAVGGMFGNPNDLAMHLATMIPLAFTMSLTARPLKKIIYLAAALLMAAAIIFTFSRGGFLGLAAAALVLAWKLGRRHRAAVVVVSIVAVASFVLFMPSEYSDRLTTIVDTARDVTGSAGAREQILIVSLSNIVRHPLFGVGMGNFHIVSLHEQVSHNAYTQVGAELGVPAMLAYLLFLLAPWRRLRRVERETLPLRRSRDYYWAVGLQAQR